MKFLHHNVSIITLMLHNLLFANGAILPHLKTHVPVDWKPGMVAFESGISSCSHVSVKQSMPHSQYSFSVQISTLSLTILLARDLKVPHNDWERRKCVFLFLCLYFSVVSGVFRMGNTPVSSWAARRYAALLKKFTR